MNDYEMIKKLESEIRTSKYMIDNIQNNCQHLSLPK